MHTKRLHREAAHRGSEKKGEGFGLKISILTIMPELFGDFLRAPVIARAVRNGVLEVELVDIREYAPGSFRHIDDSPFGGGAGMVMRCQPVLDALKACMERSQADRANVRRDCHGDAPTVGSKGCQDCHGNAPTVGQRPAAGINENVVCRPHTVLLSPAGTPYTQKKAHSLAKMPHLILLCGHYEGVDARIYPYADELVSIGDYVLTGGELAAQVIVDSVARLLPGSLREASTQEESFENGLLEYPQYTQPAVYRGEAVPEVLRSGDHARIRRWRLQQSPPWTKKMRPALFAAHALQEEERDLLEEAAEDPVCFPDRQQ